MCEAARDACDHKASWFPRRRLGIRYWFGMAMRIRYGILLDTVLEGRHNQRKSVRYSGDIYEQACQVGNGTIAGYPKHQECAA
jgi:polyferredoxin